MNGTDSCLCEWIVSFGRVRTCWFNVLLYNTFCGRPCTFRNGSVKLSSGIVSIITKTAISSNISHPFIRHDFTLTFPFCGRGFFFFFFSFFLFFFFSSLFKTLVSFFFFFFFRCLCRGFVYGSSVCFCLAYLLLLFVFWRKGTFNCVKMDKRVMV